MIWLAVGVPEADELGGRVEEGDLVDEGHEVCVAAGCVPCQNHVRTRKYVPRAALLQAARCHRPHIIQRCLRIRDTYLSGSSWDLPKAVVNQS